MQQDGTRVSRSLNGLQLTGSRASHGLRLLSNTRHGNQFPRTYNELRFEPLSSTSSLRFHDAHASICLPCKLLNKLLPSICRWPNRTPAPYSRSWTCKLDYKKLLQDIKEKNNSSVFTIHVYSIKFFVYLKRNFIYKMNSVIYTRIQDNQENKVIFCLRRQNVYNTSSFLIFLKNFN